jgi:hypothetical protein
VKLLDWSFDPSRWGKWRHPSPGDAGTEDDLSSRPRSPSANGIEFIGYAEDCTLSGRLDLAGDRLSDVMNETESLLLLNVLVTDLADGHAIELRELQVARDDLLLVHGSGPRGRADRRTRTRQHPVVARLGPYEVRGYVHTLPGSDPIRSLRRRPAIVALSDAVIEYAIGPTRQRQPVRTVLINRELAAWIVPGTDEDDELSELEIPVETGPLVKDFTGSVMGHTDAQEDGQSIGAA